MGNYYQLLHQRNVLKKQLHLLKNRHQFELSKLEKKIRKLQQIIKNLQDENHYFQKYKGEKKKNFNLIHEKWILTSILKQFKHIAISNETIETLKEKAKETHLKQYGFYDESWRIEI